MGFNHAYDLSDDELDALRKDVKPHIFLCCDADHPHTALEGCYHSDNPDKLMIAKLLEYIAILKGRVYRATQTLWGR